MALCGRSVGSRSISISCARSNACKECRPNERVICGDHLSLFLFVRSTRSSTVPLQGSIHLSSRSLSISRFVYRTPRVYSVLGGERRRTGTNVVNRSGRTRGFVSDQEPCTAAAIAAAGEIQSFRGSIGIHPLCFPLLSLF